MGIGELLARLERLRTALAAEGLFAAERKRKLPFLPGSVGLICGRDSAAERDVLRNAARRWPAVRFRVEQVAVQGPHAIEEIIEALQRLDADQAVDVIIIARGGGSIEDLLPFSDEDLVRAVAACGTPVVSAIGHEQDVPMLDLVADVRASTPTDAARRAVPDVTEQLELIASSAAVLAGLSRAGLTGKAPGSRDQVQACPGEPATRDRPAAGAGARAGRARPPRDSHRTGPGGRRSGPHQGPAARAVARGDLRRGYAIVQQADATVVLSAAQIGDGEELTVRFAADQLKVTAGQPSNLLAVSWGPVQPPARR